jgi:hypothetical protein
MYVNANGIPVETVKGIEGEEIKNAGGAEFSMMDTL